MVCIQKKKCEFSAVGGENRFSTLANLVGLLKSVRGKKGKKGKKSFIPLQIRVSTKPVVREEHQQILQNSNEIVSDSDIFLFTCV
jgi:hypothetical protein